jgi:hypothetical protein
MMEELTPEGDIFEGNIAPGFHIDPIAIPP